MKEKVNVTDLPETMKIRSRFLAETGPVYQIAKSAMDDSYIDAIDYHGENVLVMQDSNCSEYLKQNNCFGETRVILGKQYGQ